MKIRRVIFALVLSMSGSIFASGDWGFLYSHFADASVERTTAIGPIVENVDVDKGYVHSVRPFVTHWKNDTREAEQYEVLWPLYERWWFGKESNWRAGIIFSGKRFDTAEDAGRYRAWFMPFYFQGRNADGQAYHALFPVGGSMYDFLGRDQLTFALFPLWAKSNVGEQETTSVMWPVYSRTLGPRDDRHRVFPFYGYSTRKDQWHKQFAMWPLWTHARYYSENKQGSAWVLFPFYGRGEVGNERSTYVFPPFFRITRSPTQNVTNCPWPFLQFADGKTDKAYVWPFYGHKESDGNIRRFALWPIITSQSTQKIEGTQWRLNVMPFFAADSITTPDDEKRSRYWKLWPLMSYRREGDQKRFRALELWPTKYNGPIERNWQPLITLFDHQSSSDGFEQEFLWGLYRNQQSDESRHFSIFPLYEKDDKNEVMRWKLFKGLIGHEKDAVSSQWQFLYFFKTKTDVSP